MTVGTHKIAVQERDSRQTGHISKELFCDWQAGRMKQPEEERFLGHIGVCTFCAGQLGNWMEEGILEITVAEEPGNVQELTSVTECSNQSHHPLLSEPPGYLKEEILHRTHQMDVQAALHLKETSQKMQLVLYSLKVGLAVMASIFLLMVTANVQNMDFEAVRTEQMQQQRKAREHDQQMDITGTLKQKSGEISTLLNNLSNGLFRIGMPEDENEINQEVTR